MADDKDMTPPELLVEDNDKEACVSLNGDLEKTMLQILNMSNNVLHEPTCVICSNPNRKEVETKYLETKKTSEVAVILKAKSGLEVSDDIITNHMLFHVKP
jgi:hypothetical protein